MCEMLKLYDLRFKRVNVQEKSNIEKYVIRNDKNGDVDDARRASKK